MWMNFVLCFILWCVSAHAEQIECLCACSMWKSCRLHNNHSYVQFHLRHRHHHRHHRRRYNMHSHSNSTYTANIKHIRLNEDIDNDVKQVKWMPWNMQYAMLDSDMQCNARCKKKMRYWARAAQRVSESANESAATMIQTTTDGVS